MRLKVRELQVRNWALKKCVVDYLEKKMKRKVKEPGRFKARLLEKIHTLRFNRREVLMKDAEPGNAENIVSLTFPGESELFDFLSTNAGEFKALELVCHAVGRRVILYES